jgi:hypothetical protein
VHDVAKAAVEAHRTAVLKLVPGAEVEHVGATAVPVLFGLPPLVAVIGACRWVAKRRSPSLSAATTFCAAIIGSSVVLLVLAHAQSLSAD